LIDEPVIPSVEDVERIAAIEDPLLRNLEITQCYQELSRAIGGLTGTQANWCTFATWASKQAGQTIRREDLGRFFEELCRDSPELLAAVERVVECARALHARDAEATMRRALKAALDPEVAFERASDAVARGNLKVFAEIGREFARLAAWLDETARPHPMPIEAFVSELRAGEPPEGQRLLREAFLAYHHASSEADEKARAELILLGNLLVGLHEQTRLQPDIVEALEASISAKAESRHRLFAILLPGPWLRLRHRLWRLIGREPPVDAAIERFSETVRRLVREAITRRLMTLRVPPDEVLHLGRDVRAGFPPSLREIANPVLAEFLALVDPTPDDTQGSGAVDWGGLDHRMHFIADFFRAYQARPAMWDAPFTAAQVVAMRAGQRPEGPL
jgi:hypothetical protein